MELQFEKRTMPCLQQVLWDSQIREVTQELRLPDGMPDIGKVVSCWVQPVIRGKEWRSDRIGINGGVMCWVLYTPEEEGPPQAVTAWMPYQMKWDIPQTRHDGTILAQPFLQNADARSLSARKMMLRANVGANVRAVAPGEIVIHTPEQVPEDVQMLRRTYPMQIPVEAGEKAFQIEEEIPFPNALPQPSHIVRYSLRPELTEWKIMTDKAVFRGTAMLHLLYRDGEGSLHTWDYELPISQYADLDREYETDAVVSVLPAVTNLELDITDSGLALKAGLTGQYMVYERPMVELVEDAYSPVRQVSTNVEMLQIPAVLETLQDSLRVEQSVDADAGRVIDLAFYPDVPQSSRDENGFATQFPGFFQLLTQNGDGALESAHAYWEESRFLPAADNVRMQMQVFPGGTPQASLGGGILMQGDLLTQAEVITDQGLPMVTGLSFGEATQPDPGRPSLLLQRAGEQSLWEIAKATGTTVDSIRKANKLEGEPEAGKLLIIPVP